MFRYFVRWKEGLPASRHYGTRLGIAQSLTGLCVNFLDAADNFDKYAVLFVC